MGLIWFDDCDKAAGYAPDAGLWGQQLTDQYQNASEQQYYLRGTRNAQYDGAGHLVLKAIKEPTNGYAYSSARLFTRTALTRGLFRYGLFEARIKVPTGAGIWPAWWLLGLDNPYSWPQCGEIDVMEAPASSSTLNQVHMGTHSPSAANPANEVSKAPPGTPVTAPPGTTWGDAYHTYAVEWTPGRLEWFIDEKPTGVVTRADVEAAGGRWVFDHRPASLVLNVAVGGWAGTPDPAWTEQAMYVDFVRVWE
jgi:beta-glucanase (GH16 family)